MNPAPSPAHQFDHSPLSAPRTNQQNSQQQPVSKPPGLPLPLTLPSPGQKPRVVTPDLPTVPCPPEDIAEGEEESLEQIEEDIREYNRSMMESIQTMVATIKGTLKEEKEEPQQLPMLLLTKEQSMFNIPATNSPKFINIHLIGEAASKVLFSTVHWARQLPYFASLHQTNQNKILRRCWLDLFVLGLAQNQEGINMFQVTEVIMYKKIDNLILAYC